MYECFMEIGFEAELNTKEDPELCKLAEDFCNEYQDTRAAVITELRHMIFDREECFPFRMDDEFLLRFLRAKKFIVRKAHKLLVRYCAFREQYKQLYEGVDLWGLTRLNNVYAGTMYDHPDTGRISIFQFGKWDPNEYPIEELVRAGLAMMEIGVRQPKLQVLGGTVIVDLEGMTLKHVSSMTPTVAYQMVCLMGLAVPGRMRSCHIINYSWILNTFLFLFKRFIPQKAWDSIHFHGNDVKSLQQHISLDCLPTKYGGNCRSTAGIGVWLKKIKKYRDEQFDKEMKSMGYVIKE